jgi:hypothetical protein
MTDSFRGSLNFCLLSSPGFKILVFSVMFNSISVMALPYGRNLDRIPCVR